MKRLWTIIGVRDVHASFSWYDSLLDNREKTPAHDDFGQIIDADGTVLLCVHAWGAHEHPPLLSADAATPGNGLLLFFRLTSIVTLVAAAWIAVGASDRGEPMVRLSPLEAARRQELAEHETLLTAARIRVRDARAELARTPWFRRLPVRARLRFAEEELAQLEGSTDARMRV